MFPNTTNHLNTYLGPKGYTLFKKELNPDQEKMIKTELTVKPFVQGSPANNTSVSFPAYRESPNKYYLPRYFGQTHFGPPKQIKVNLDFFPKCPQREQSVQDKGGLVLSLFRAMQWKRN